MTRANPRRRLPLYVASLLVAAMLSACTEDSGASSDESGSSSDESGGEALPFSLWSSAFADGATIPTAHTCDGSGTSPELSWGMGMVAAQSFVLVLRDETAQIDHYAVYEIPTSIDMLPAALEPTYQPDAIAGARQTSSPFGGFGYFGPCPIGGGTHTYAFELHALDVERLEGFDQTSTTTTVRAAIEAHGLETTVLRGTYARP